MKNPKEFLRRASADALEPLRSAGSKSPAFVNLSGSGADLLTGRGKKKWVASLHHEIEGVHFDPTFLTPFDLGSKSLAAALFQVAASGGKPRFSQVSVGVNQSTTEPFLGEVFRGIEKVARRFDISLGFGNSVHSPTSFFLSLMTFSEVVSPQALPRRGDLLAVTGELGRATAGLQCLRRFGWPAVKDHASVVRAHLCPEPPLSASLALAVRKGLASQTPILDGLSSDLHRLCSAAGVGAYIQEDKLPIGSETRTAASLLSANARRWALFGADDFGLLIAVSPRKWAQVSTLFRKSSVAITAIGEVTSKSEKIRMKNLEGEEVELANRSWNPIVRRKTG